MIKRVVEISSGPTHLSVRHGQLILTRNKDELGQVSFEDLGMLVIDHPSVTYSHTALCKLSESNIAVVLCGKNHHPAGMILPIDGHTTQSEIVANQSSITQRQKKGLWKDIVTTKICHQARLLDYFDLDGTALYAMSKKVKSGDPDNLEAQAARRYWPKLFGKSFRRHRFGEPPNNLLNYGYMVLRAAVARAICGAGLHPSLGLHHKNKYNSFVLADDLMEPLRPLVDKIACELWGAGNQELKKDTKSVLLSLLTEQVEWQGEKSPLMISLHRYTASLKRVFTGEGKRLHIQKIIYTSKE